MMSIRTYFLGLLIGISLTSTLFPVEVFAAPLTCECVRWLREAQGVPIKGDAWTLTPTHSVKNADMGNVLLTTEGPGHAALIIGFEGQVAAGSYTHPAFIRVLETNYTRCKVGTRLIAWNDPKIKGVIHIS